MAWGYFCSIDYYVFGMRPNKALQYTLQSTHKRASLSFFLYHYKMMNIIFKVTLQLLSELNNILQIKDF